MIAGLYRRYAPELVRYIRKYTEDQAAAEDIVQETFVRGMEHGSQLEMLEESIRKYQNRVLTAVEVIDELIKLSQEIKGMDKEQKEIILMRYIVLV